MNGQTVQLRGESIDLSGEEVADLCRQLGVPVPGKVTIESVAKATGRSVDFVYDHAEQFGFRKIGAAWVYFGAAPTPPPPPPEATSARRRWRPSGAPPLDFEQ